MVCTYWALDLHVWLAKVASQKYALTCQQHITTSVVVSAGLSVEWLMLGVAAFGLLKSGKIRRAGEVFHQHCGMVCVYTRKAFVMSSEGVVQQQT